MTTDEEKSRLVKLLQGLEPEINVTKRCYDLVNAFKEKFGKEVEEEESKMNDYVNDTVGNPYIVDQTQLAETEQKLQELAKQRNKKVSSTDLVPLEADPKRPWRTNSHREKLLRIENELKRHRDKGSDAILPMEDAEMDELVKECRQETLECPPVAAQRLRDTVEAARKNLPNFKYKKIENSTATAILPKAHELEAETPKELDKLPAIE